MRLWRIVCARSHQSARASAPQRRPIGSSWGVREGLSSSLCQRRGLHQAPQLWVRHAALAHCLRQEPSKRARERARAPYRIRGSGRAQRARLRLMASFSWRSQPCHGLVTRSEGCPRFQREESPPGPGRDHGEQCSAVCSLACSTHIRTFLNYHVSVPIYTHATCNEPFAHSNVFLPSLPWVLFYFCAPQVSFVQFSVWTLGAGAPSPKP